MIVYVINTPAHNDAFVNVKDTFRIGFPTAKLCELNNINLDSHDYLMRFIFATGITNNEPVVFLDPDTILYSEIQSKLETLYKFYVAGRLILNYWNHIVEANEVRRFHTSLLCFPRPRDLKEHLDSIESCQNYPYNPFAPFIYFLNGTKFFYDTTAQLFNTIPSGLRYNFPEDILDSYSHIGCATMLDKVKAKVPNGDKLIEYHKIAKSNPEALKYLWREQDLFYSKNVPRI